MIAEIHSFPNFIGCDQTIVFTVSLFPTWFHFSSFLHNPLNTSTIGPMKHDIPFLPISIHHQPIVFFSISPCNFKSISIPSYRKKIRLRPLIWAPVIVITEFFIFPSHIIIWIKVIYTQCSFFKIFF